LITALWIDYCLFNNKIYRYDTVVRNHDLGIVVMKDVACAYIKNKSILI